MVDAMLVNIPGHGHQVGKHRIAHRGGDLGIAQRIQADVDDAALADNLQPVEDRSRILQIGVVGSQQLRGLAAGEFFQQWQQRGNDLVEIGAVVAHRRAQAVHHRLEQAFGGQVLLEGDHALLAADHVPGVFFSLSRPSICTMASHACGSWRAKNCWAYSMNSASMLTTWRWICR